MGSCSNSINQRASFSVSFEKWYRKRAPFTKKLFQASGLILHSAINCIRFLHNVRPFKYPSAATSSGHYSGFGRHGYWSGREKATHHPPPGQQPDRPSMAI